MAELVDPHFVARIEQDRGALLFDDRRPVQSITRFEPAAQIDRAIDRLLPAIKNDSPLAALSFIAAVTGRRRL